MRMMSAEEILEMDWENAERIPIEYNVESYREWISDWSSDVFESEEAVMSLLAFTSDEGDDFDIYANELLSAAKVQGSNLDAVQRVIDIAKGYTVPGQLQIEDIVKMLDEIRSNEYKVTLLPLMCGAGKSQAISHYMKKTLEADNGEGLLVVTDKVDRMEDYLNPVDPEVRDYLQRNKEHIVVMTHENIETATKKQWSCPILIMSTQRYMNLTPGSINGYLKWSGGTRPLVIIDEYAQLKETVCIRRKDINDVLSMISEGIAYGFGNEEKDWCIDQWHKLIKRINDQVSTMEKLYDDNEYMLFFNDDRKQLTDDDQRFWSFITATKSESMNYSANAFKSLRSINKMICEGALYECIKYGKDNYQSEFAVVLDNKEKITDINAKTIILDATGDVHPDYKQDFIHIHKVDIKKRVLHNLSITFVDMPTSKSSYLKMNEEQRSVYNKAAFNYVQKGVRGFLPVNTVFTYKQVESEASDVFAATDHFGAIKGSNKYRHEPCIVQIGLNQQKPLQYACYDLANDEDVWKKLQSSSVEESRSTIDSFVCANDHDSDTRNSMMLTDLEQNIFRSAIRNPSMLSGISYYIFCRKDTNKKLIDATKERFELRGATVQVEDKPLEIKEDKVMRRKPQDGTKATKAQLFWSWYKSIDQGTKYTKKDIADAIGEDLPAIDKLISHSSNGIKERLKQDIIKGQKQGRAFVYQKA